MTTLPNYDESLANLIQSKDYGKIMFLLMTKHNPMGFGEGIPSLGAGYDLFRVLRHMAADLSLADKLPDDKLLQDLKARPCAPEPKTIEMALGIAFLCNYKPLNSLKVLRNVLEQLSALYNETIQLKSQHGIKTDYAATRHLLKLPDPTPNTAEYRLCHPPFPQRALGDMPGMIAMAWFQHVLARDMDTREMAVQYAHTLAAAINELHYHLFNPNSPHNAVVGGGHHDQDGTLAFQAAHNGLRHMGC